jgi:hypothetical protein
MLLWFFDTTELKTTSRFACLLAWRGLTHSRRRGCRCFGLLALHCWDLQHIKWYVPFSAHLYLYFECNGGYSRVGTCLCHCVDASCVTEVLQKENNGMAVNLSQKYHDVGTGTR